VKPLTEHQMIDLGDLAKRAADIGLENKADIKEMKPLVAQIPEIKTMLKLALAPQTMPVYVRISAPLAAIALVVIAIAFTLYLSRSASASSPEQSPRVQAVR
jgi:lipopolysaccharide export LptBFGC system permease protein LptF